jgi:hypothetical protein
MHPWTLKFVDDAMECELTATQFASSYETYQLLIGGTVIHHAVILFVSPELLLISAIYGPIAAVCLVARYFLHQLEDQQRAHMLCQRLWMGALSVGPGLQWTSIQLGYHPRVAPVSSLLYMFAYAMVVMTMHIMYFDVQSRLTCMLCMVLSLSTSGWGGWSGEAGWSVFGQPYETGLIFLSVLIGSLFGYTLERMMRASFLQQQSHAKSEGEYRDQLQAMQASVAAERLSVATPAPDLQADIAPHSFEILALIGKGGSGDVFLVQRRQKAGEGAAGTSELLALKRIVKVGLGAHRSAQLLEECRIIQQLHCPFIVRLEEAFQTRSCVYLAMTYAGGGDLTRWIDEVTASSAQLVMAEVLIALRYLHSMSVIYRDLKLENTLVGADGHILLSDFGVSKRLLITLQEEEQRLPEDAEPPTDQPTNRRRARKVARTVLGTVSRMARRPSLCALGI